MSESDKVDGGDDSTLEFLAFQVYDITQDISATLPLEGEFSRGDGMSWRAGSLRI